MIVWQDSAILINKIKHGENHAIITVLTQNHGRVSGLVYGAYSSKKHGILEKGNIIKCDYSSKTENSLATIKVELQKNTLSYVIDSMDKLLIISSACKIIYDLVPEQDVSLKVYNLIFKLVNNIAEPNYLEEYVKFEWNMLDELGYGINTGSCVATGVLNGFAYVSPKSWQVVSKTAGEPYSHVLLELPKFLLNEGIEGSIKDDILKGLKLTNYFLLQVYKEQSKKFKPLLEEIANKK